MADLWPLPPRPPTPESSSGSDSEASNEASGLSNRPQDPDVDAQLKEGIARLSLSAQPPAPIAVDIEGVQLCRYGRVSIVQMLKDGGDTIWLLDVTVLGKSAFVHEDIEGRSIKRLLECVEIKKIFYDVRMDADALYHIYGVDMKNVLDLQVLELAWRGSNGRDTRFLNGLKRSLEDYVRPPLAWRRTKEAGVKLFKPEEGGSYAVFEERPLDARILAYCAQDVSYLHPLEKGLRNSLGRIGSSWSQRVDMETTRRLEFAKGPVMLQPGRHKAIAPKI